MTDRQREDEYREALERIANAAELKLGFVAMRQTAQAALARSTSHQEEAPLGYTDAIGSLSHGTQAAPSEEAGEGQKRLPRMALRKDPDDTLDDVVVKDVPMFRAEMMSDEQLWMCCHLSNGERIDFWVSANSPLRFSATDVPPYEDIDAARSSEAGEEWEPTAEPITNAQVEALNKLTAIKAGTQEIDWEAGEEAAQTCPTCGSRNRTRRPLHAAGDHYVECPDPFHQPPSSDCEGDGEDETKWDLDTKLRMFDKGEEPGDERWTIWRRTCGELKGAWQIGTPPEVPPIPPYENEVVEVCPAYLLDALRRAYIDASSDLKRDT